MQTVLERVAIVRALYRYPVKSMVGEAVEDAQVGWHGIAGDRRYAFTRTNQLVDFPWLTASRLPELLLYTPRFTTPDPIQADLEVTTPDGRVLDLASTELTNELCDLFGAPVQLMRRDSGIFDQAALSLISQETIGALGKQTGRTLEHARFRPNIVIETLDGQPFREDAWVGQLLVFGEHGGVAMRVNERDLRCVMVNIDPTTLAKDARVLKTIVQQHETLLGVYGSTERVGMDPRWRPRSACEWHMKG